MGNKKKIKKKDEIDSENLNLIVTFALICVWCIFLFIEGEHVWSFLREFLFGIFGINYIFILLNLIFIFFLKLKNKEINNFRLNLFYAFEFIFSILLGIFVFPDEICFRYFYEKGIKNAGVLSGSIDIMLVNLFGITAARAFLFIIFLTFFLILFKSKFVFLFNKIRFKIKKNDKSLNLIKTTNKNNFITEKISDFEDFKPEKQTNNCKFFGDYSPPSVDFLKKSDGNKNLYENSKNNSILLIESLENFKIKSKIVGVFKGPTVTRYEIQPAPGVKVSKIISLSDDIALSLASSEVRIEAPIPGKSAVGIEVPNEFSQIVRVREIIDSEEFTSSKSCLTVALGKDISGKCIVADLKKMPHILVAGSTGSGKSVCINSFIVSIIYNSSPNDVKLLMIDPKVVELGVYNGIPHLLIPVVTDAKKAPGVLKWAVEEMLKRYRLFAEISVKDITSYNFHIKKRKSNEKTMPNIVIIIDELADLMMVAQKEIEDYICRLTQMARAAGMHLVIATQRPSVDVITGIIKANIPSRIALAVSSQVDSRTILDSSGAEKLLGRGDMLFSPMGSLKPMRIQGCYVEDEEIEKITYYLRKNFEAKYNKNAISEIEKFNEQAPCSNKKMKLKEKSNKN